MPNPNNAPVSARELDRFARTVAEEVDRSDFDAERVFLIAAVDDGTSIDLLVSNGPAAATSAQLDQLFGTRRRLVAMVTVTGWSPADDLPVSTAWVMVTVGVGGEPAHVVVRRVHEDRRWTWIAPHSFPYFVMSTAAGLRAAIETGEPIRIKTVGSPALYRRVGEGPVPPLDEQGEL